MTCVVSQYIHTGATQPEITYEWLSGLIQHAGLCHVCQHCRRIGFPHVFASAGNSTGESTTQDARVGSVYHQNVSNDIVNIKMSVLDLASKLNIMATNIDFFRHELSKKLLDSSSNVAALSISTSTAATHHTSSLSEVPRPPAYADVVASGLLKTAESEALKEDRKAISDGCTIVVYGFPEDGSDHNDLMDMFDFLCCRCVITRQARIGHAASHDANSKCHPTKVELISSGAVDFLLVNARHLREDNFYSGANICRWLSRDELNELRLVRQQCNDLNDITPVDRKGRKS